jgi:hypothetical protein
MAEYSDHALLPWLLTATTGIPGLQSSARRAFLETGTATFLCAGKLDIQTAFGAVTEFTRGDRVFQNTPL